MQCHSAAIGNTQAYARAIPETPSALGALDASGRAEFWASLALCHTQGLGGRSRKKLLSAFGSAFEAVQRVQDWRSVGIKQETIALFASEAWRVAAKQEWDATRGLVGRVLLWTDSWYPPQLREIPDAPVRLYCQGDISLLSNACIGIVGRRQCSEEGLRAASAIAAGVAASGMTVVSGLAIGIDRQAHMASLGLPGSTIAVLGAGLDVVYPKQNHRLRQQIAEQGLLVSEYAPGTPPEPGHFPVRNRIISGLSLGVLVVEAALRSGSLITARLALEHNRTVYAVAGSIGAPSAQGCQELIRQGAQPVFSSEDIVRDLAGQLQERCRSGMPLARSPSSPSASPHVSTDCVPDMTPVRVHTTDRAEASPTCGETSLPQTSRAASPLPPSSPSSIWSPQNTAKTALRPETPLPTVPRKTAAAPVGAFSELETRIITLLGQEQGGISVDSLCQRLDAPVEAVSAAVVMLEVQGILSRLANLHYKLV